MGSLSTVTENRSRTTSSGGRGEPRSPRPGWAACGSMTCAMPTPACWSAMGAVWGRSARRWVIRPPPPPPSQWTSTAICGPGMRTGCEMRSTGHGGRDRL